MTYTLKYINGSRSILFSYESGYWISRITGLVEQSVTFGTARDANGIGEYVESRSLDAKQITIDGSLSGYAKDKKRAMLNAFLPMATGQLILNDTYTLDDVEVKVTPRIQAYEYDPAYQIQLYAAHPFWRGSTEKAILLFGEIPAWGFPWDIDDYQFTQRVDDAYIDVTNTGLVPARWIVEMDVQYTVANPRVTHVRSGKYVGLRGTFDAGEKFVIDTTGKGIKVTGITPQGQRYNAFKRLDYRSKRFNLDVGENLIRTSSEVNPDGVNMIMRTYEYTSGVPL